MTNEETKSYSDVESDTTTTVKKNSLVTAYAETEADIEDKREFLDAAFGDQLEMDPMSMHGVEKEDVSIEMTIPGETSWGEEQTATKTVSVHGSDRDVVRHAVESGTIEHEDIPWLDVSIETYVSQEYENSIRKIL